MKEKPANTITNQKALHVSGKHRGRKATTSQTPLENQLKQYVDDTCNLCKVSSEVICQMSLPGGQILRVYLPLIFPFYHKETVSCTEKATILSEQNKTVFKVHEKANKETIKKNIEKLFKVNVIKVNIINIIEMVFTLPPQLSK